MVNALAYDFSYDYDYDVTVFFQPVEHRVVSGDGGATHPPQQYADVSFHRSDKQRVESPMKKPALEYAEVYVSENQGIASPPVYSEARAIPRPANRKTEFRESYENMHLNKELLSKYVFLF